MLNPAIDRRVVHCDAAFGHHRFEIAVADRVPAVPAHGPKHDLTAEVASLEIAHPPTPRSSLRRQFTTPASNFATEPPRLRHREMSGGEGAPRGGGGHPAVRRSGERMKRCRVMASRAESGLRTVFPPRKWWPHSPETISGVLGVVQSVNNCARGWHQATAIRTAAVARGQNSGAGPGDLRTVLGACGGESPARDSFQHFGR